MDHRIEKLSIQLNTGHVLNIIAGIGINSILLIISNHCWPTILEGNNSNACTILFVDGRVERPRLSFELWNHSIAVIDRVESLRVHHRSFSSVSIGNSLFHIQYLIFKFTSPEPSKVGLLSRDHSSYLLLHFPWISFPQ